MHGKVNYLIKQFFSSVGYYKHPSRNSRQLILNLNTVVLIVFTCYGLRNLTILIRKLTLFLKIKDPKLQTLQL